MELKYSDAHYEWQVQVLLIVPYGIEIITSSSVKSLNGALNRTLWN